jgi:hypothetical protein
MFRTLMAAGIAASVVVSATAAASAQTPYYEGKTVTLVVGFSPGGGTDLFGRAFAEHLGRFIEGNPAVIVENMPGAGSVIASNYYTSQAERDGTVVLVGTGQLLMRILLGLDGSDAELADLEPLVASPMGRITYGSSTLGIESGADLMAAEETLILGVPEVISTIDAVLGLEVLGAEFQAIVGYEGKSDTRLALERGEINVDEQTTPLYLTSVTPLVEEGTAVPLFSQGLMDGDELVRDPAAPDVPTVAEVYEAIHGTPPSGPAWDAYVASIRAIGNGGKILMIHSDTPDEARAALTAAIDEMVADPEFLAAASALLEGYGFNTGESLAASVAGIADTDPATLQWLRDLLTSEYEMSFQ